MAQKKIGVVHVVKSLGLGGTEKTAQLLAGGLDRSIFSPVLLALADGPRRPLAEAAGLPVYVCSDLLRALDRLDPDIVHVHRAGWPEPGLMRPIALYRAERARRRQVARDDGERFTGAAPETGLAGATGAVGVVGATGAAPATGFAGAAGAAGAVGAAGGVGATGPAGAAGVAVVETNVFGRHDPSPSGCVVDLRLFVSLFCLRRYEAVHGPPRPGSRHEALYNPVDTDFFAARCPDRELAATVLGRLSRPDPGKWSPLALEILPLLAARLPDFAWRVVGATDEARAYVAAHGLSGRVAFLDPITDEEGLAAFFNSISVLAHANATGETFGLVIAEAMAAGLPVVTHPCPPPRDNAQVELVEHGRTGFVATDAPGYAEAVARLLTDPELARSMGRAGRDKARREFSLPLLAGRLGELYLELLGPGRGGPA